MDDPEQKQLKQNVEEIREITERNHELIKSIERSLFWRRVLRIFYWVVLIGVAVGAFYFLQPYVDRVLGVYQEFKDGLEGLNSLPTGS